jgi:hypothetical protein
MPDVEQPSSVGLIGNAGGDLASSLILALKDAQQRQAAQVDEQRCCRPEGVWVGSDRPLRFLRIR